MTMTTMTTALGAEISLASLWVPLMLSIFALNGAAALACVVFVLHKTDSRGTNAIDDPVEAEAAFRPTGAPPCITRQNAIAQKEDQDQLNSLRLCGKRKTREQPAEFPLARRPHSEVDDEITQGRAKQRRIAKVTRVYRVPRRSSSFGCDTPSAASPSATPSPLRRVASCGDSPAGRFFSMARANHAASTVVCRSDSVATTAVATASIDTLLREIRLRDVLSSAKAVVVAKLREAARNAIDEVLTSIISFATYGLLLFILRQYSAVAVGVSLDLGAFSIEL